MADIENKVLLEVSTGDSIKNVADLTAYIKAQKEALKDDSASIEDNQRVIKDLTAAQSKLREVMNTSKMSINDAIGYRRNEHATYNELVRDLAELTKAYRTTSDATEQAKIAKNVKDVNDRLKEMDKAMGSNKRNVGNYADSFVSAFSKMGGGAAAVINPIKGATAGLQAMSATPVVAIMGLLANVLAKVADSFKTNEQASNALRVALAPLKVLSEGITKVTEQLAEWIGKVASGITDMLVRLKLLKGATEDYKAETIEEIALQKERRRVNEANAESEVKIAELRAQIAEKDKYSYKERLQFAQEWKAELMAVAARNKEVAERELALLERQASHTQNSKEMNDRLSEARVKVSNATRDYNEQLRRCNSTIAELTTKTETHAEVLTEKLEPAVKDITLSFKSLWEQELALTKQINDDWEKTVDDAGALGTKYTEQFLEDTEKRKEAAEEEAAARKAAYIDAAYSVAGSTSSILNSIADIYEANGDATEENLNQIKNMRIAGATIDTISGAIGAFATAAANPGGIPGMIIGAANAAAITAAGIAQIAQIKNTNVSKSGTSAGSIAVSAPSITTSVPTTAITTSSTLDERIADIADRPVVILESELQIATKRSNTKVSETSYK